MLDKIINQIKSLIFPNPKPLDKAKLLQSYQVTFDEFLKLLIVLSASADKQIACVGYGYVGLELREDFHTFYSTMKDVYLEHNFLTEAQFDQLIVMEDYFDEQDEVDNFYYNNEHLQHHDFWEKMRKQAKVCREELGIANWGLKSEVKNKRGLQSISWKLIKNGIDH